MKGDAWLCMKPQNAGMIHGSAGESLGFVNAEAEVQAWYGCPASPLWLHVHRLAVWTGFRHEAARATGYFGVTFMMLPTPEDSAASAQYTLVVSTAMPKGFSCPEARSVTAPPPTATFITVSPS